VVLVAVGILIVTVLLEVEAVVKAAVILSVIMVLAVLYMVVAVFLIVTMVFIIVIFEANGIHPQPGYPVHSLQPHFPKIHFNIILPSTPRCSVSPIPLSFEPNFYAFVKITRLIY
jgi:hypothetical protein